MQNYNHKQSFLEHREFLVAKGQKMLVRILVITPNEFKKRINSSFEKRQVTEKCLYEALFAPDETLARHI